MKKTVLIIFLLPYIGFQTLKAQKPISLEEAITVALANNPAVNADKQQIKEAEAKHMQAKSSMLPQADLLSKYFYSNNLPGMYVLEGTNVNVMNNGAPTGDYVTLHPMAPYPNFDRDVSTFDFNMVYPIYTGNKRKSAIESTNQLKNAYEEKLNETKADLVLKVKTAYYNALLINEVIKVYEDAQKQLYSHLALAEKAYEEGLRSEFDVLNFKSKIENFNSTIIDFKGKKAIVNTALRNLMSLPSDEEIIIEGTISDFYDLKANISNPELNTIQSNNYTVKYLKNMQSVLEQKKNMEKAAKLPTLFAFGNYHIYHGMDFPPFDETWRNGYAVGLGVKIKLFDGNMSKAKVAEVEATENKLAEYEKGMNLKLRYEFEKSNETIISLEAKQIAEKKNLEVAQKAYKIAKVGYKSGVLTNIELNDSQLNMTKIKTSILANKKDILIEYAHINYLNGVQN